MKTKFLSFVLVGVLSASAFAADYSKTSNQELINLSGKVAPKDYPDYKMEIHKRIQDMKVKDAVKFRDDLRNARMQAFDSMSVKEHREYRNAIRVETQKRIEKMSEKEAREKGLLKGHGKGANKEGWHKGRGRDCPPCSRF